MRTPSAQHVIDVASAIAADVKAGVEYDDFTVLWALFIVMANQPAEEAVPA